MHAALPVFQTRSTRPPLRARSELREIIVMDGAVKADLSLGWGFKGGKGFKVCKSVGRIYRVCVGGEMFGCLSAYM